MPTAPKTLAADVIRAVAFMVKEAPKPWPRDTKLVAALGLTQYQLKALAVPFERIAKKYTRKDSSISRTACAKLTTLQKAIDLVASTAGFTVPTP